MAGLVGVLLLPLVTYLIGNLVLMERADALPKLLTGYPKLSWWFFLWAPAALALPWLTSLGIDVPDSDVSILAHKPGNIGSDDRISSTHAFSLGFLTIGLA